MMKKLFVFLFVILAVGFVFTQTAVAADSVPVSLKNVAPEAMSFQLFVDDALKCEVLKRNDSCSTTVDYGSHVIQVRNLAGKVCIDSGEVRIASGMSSINIEAWSCK